MNKSSYKLEIITKKEKEYRLISANNGKNNCTVLITYKFLWS